MPHPHIHFEKGCYAKKPWLKNCKVCDKPVPKGQHRYCSGECYKKRYAARYKNDPEWREKRKSYAIIKQKRDRRAALDAQVRSCRICSKQYTPNRGNVKYCSPRCRKIYQSKSKGVKVMARRKVDPVFRLRNNFTSDVYKALRSRGFKKQCSSVLHLPYTIPQLKAHLESFFNNKNGFTWENHGKIWQIDHIIPHEYFQYTTLDCKIFRDCWALSNLFPAPKWFNSFKGDRFAGSIDDDGQLFLFL